MTERKESRAAQARKAEKILLGLLRTPKTRAGLVAAVVGKKISRRFVFGWLAEKEHIGIVVCLKSTATVTYQLASTLSVEAPREGDFPSWLEPRVLPTVVARTAYIDGVKVGANPQHKSTT